MLKTYKIYLITNLINGKIYVGRTYKELEKRFEEHIQKANGGSKYRICMAIRKYGRENFKIELIENNENLKENQIRETFYILKFKSYERHIGYNIKISELKIDGTPCYTEESLEKMKMSQQKRELKPGKKYRGVYYSNKYKRYEAALNAKGKSKSYRKCFQTIEEAARYYDRLVIHYYGHDACLNFPEDRDLYIKLDTEEDFKELTTFKKASKYNGVTYTDITGVYKALLTWQGKQYALYTFKEEIDAAIFYDKVYYLLFRNTSKLNFPEKINEYILEEENTRKSWKFYTRRHRPNADNQCGYRGVLFFKWGQRTRRWLAKIRHKDKITNLGYYHTKEEAAKIYDRKAVEIWGTKAQLNFPDNDYSEQLNLYNLANPTIP